MFTFLVLLFIAAALIVANRVAKRSVGQTVAVGAEGGDPSQGRRYRQPSSPVWARIFARKFVPILAVVVAIIAVANTSVIWVSSGQFATLKRVYGGTALPPGKIVATDGELGPQAEIITAGFHPRLFVTIANVIEYHDVYTVPQGQCAKLSAKDGAQPPNGTAFAEPWSQAAIMKMANDAQFFLKNGGQRGPQSTVLFPGSYTLHPYLWEAPELVPAMRVEQGFVGVVKSSLHAAVDFGQLKREKPTSNELVVLKGRLPAGAASAALVPVGAVGVWEEALRPNLYYLNPDCYRITMIPVAAQVYEYRGGYKRRTVEIAVDKKGEISERVSESEVLPVPQAADQAIFCKPEGWDVAQELRVQAQITPEMAPFVVASLAITEANASSLVEDRVVTPVIRSVVRDVLGGALVRIQRQVSILDAGGKPVLDAQGVPTTELKTEFRAVKVMDLLENRASLEEAAEERARPECLKEGVTLLEVRLSDSNIPAELLIARKREQLAQQLSKAWAEEERAQQQRQKTENAKAMADQQSVLVEAEIKQQRAKQLAQARETEAKGEQAYLNAITLAQKEQTAVLGQEGTLRLRMFEVALKALEGIAEKNPDVLKAAFENPSKWVPTVVVNSGGSAGGSLEGAAAVFGHLLRASPTTQPAPAADK